MNTLKFSPGRRMFPHPFFGTFGTNANCEDAFAGKDYANFVPSVNISETEKEWHIEVSAPGFKKEDFKINLEKSTLTISAEQKAEETKTEKNYSRREFSYGSFSRSFRIKENTVEVENIGAAYDNGILNITLPKVAAAPAKEVKEIKVA
ncbi:MAG TPA: Hsp20/alpha crystallin family protein [Bacteroidia bacterium]|nr:Hsp20/alpha crystallin family protein [Bacteroidia bacterium]